MITTAILNVVLALGVIIMVVTPLVWAIFTQHREHPGTAATDCSTIHLTQPQTRSHARQPRHTPVIGQA
jgi:hypothetical protein